MRKGGTDLGPLFSGFAVALLIFDGEDAWIAFVFRAAVNPSMDAAGKTFCAFAILQRTESR
jgi:hypothetical protein